MFKAVNNCTVVVAVDSATSSVFQARSASQSARMLGVKRFLITPCATYTALTAYRGHCVSAQHFSCHSRVRKPPNNGEYLVASAKNVSSLSDEELSDNKKEQLDGASSSVTDQQSVFKVLEEKLSTPLDTQPSVDENRPLVLIVSGPSGVGKDSVIQELCSKRTGLSCVVTATTRSMRPGETHGIDYFFISKDEFQERLYRNEFLEHAIVYGEYKGIPRKEVEDKLARGVDVVLRVDVQGAATMRSILPTAISIFIVAENERNLVSRLVSRKTEQADKLLIRVETAREEMKRMSEFDYCVVNRDGQLQTTVDKLSAIIDAEKMRVKAKGCA